MSWIIRPALETFDQHRDAWDALNHDHHILRDSAFVALLLRHFGSRDVLLAISTDHTRPGMLLLCQPRRGLWQTFQPSQAPLGLAVLPPADDTSHMRSLLRCLPGFALSLDLLQQHPDCAGIPATGSSTHVDIQPYIEAPRIRLPATLTEFWAERRPSRRLDLARLRRRLAEQRIPVDLTIDREPAVVADAILEHGRLEGTGWKQRLGTAIDVHTTQGRFYRELFEHFCRRGEAMIFRLLFDGKTVATKLCLIRGEMLIILKIAYDESTARYSPGFLLTQDLIHALYTEPHVRVIEYYGRVMPYHSAWTNVTRTMYHVTFFRHAWVRTFRDHLKQARRMFERSSSR